MLKSASTIGLGLYFVASCIAGSEAEDNRSGEVLRELLAMLSPTVFERAMRGPESTAPNPADLRAGSELALLGYWAQGFRAPRERLPNPPAAALLRAVSSYPDRLPDLLPVLPFERESFAPVKELYDRSIGESWCDDGWKSTAHDWLMMHSDYFRADLIQEARLATDTDGYVEGSDRLEALAALDWEAALPVLDHLAHGREPRTAALALTILYKRAAATGASRAAAELRSQLLRLAEDTEAPGRAIDSAIEALLTTDWEGRDAWYLRLLENPALGDLHDDSWGFAPLAVVVERDPDHWIPRISELVGSSNRALHDQAVGILVRFHLDRAREDALRPLLPWIEDPAWASAPDRLRLIQSVDLLGLREAIPGLIVALEHADEWSQYIADTLGNFQAREAIPALRRALQRDSDSFYRQSIIRALVKLGGFSVAELAAAVERFTEQSSTEEGRDAILESRFSAAGEEALDLGVHIGEFVCRSDFQPSEELARSLLARVQELQKTKPSTAKDLLHLLASWSARSLDQYFAGKLLTDEIDAASTASLLMRRQDVRANALGVIRKALLREGLPRGVAAILLEDSNVVREILRQGTRATRIALFAAARVVDEELPLSLVSPLLTATDSEVARAAERYLETNDRSNAREVLWKKYPGRAWILGHSTPGDPDGDVDATVSQRELALRQELFRAEGPREIFAWMFDGYWTGSSWREVRFWNSGGRLTCENGSRDLTPAEGAALLDVVAQRAADDLGYFTTHVTDCAHVEYLHLTRDRGRRVAMYCPREGRGSDHFVLNEIFENLACPESAESDRTD